MTAPTPVGFLDFFILEASEYVDQLDALLLAARSSASGPDAEALQRVARALRGSATMAKLSSFAEVAAGLERVGRGLRENALAWDAALSGALVSAVDDCKISLRNVRNWGPADDARARTHVAELVTFVGTRTPTPLATANTVGHDGYLATETSNIGAGLELLATRPSDHGAATNVLRRVRALRGIASVKDRPSLGDVLEGAEFVVQPLENAGGSASAERVALLRTAAELLRSIASAIHGTGAGPAPSVVKEFDIALSGLRENEANAMRVIPIAELFYGDGGSGIVETSANPPTTPAERFRLEASGQGENLRRLVSDAASAAGDARDRIARKLSSALTAFSYLADSFGAKAVARFAMEHTEGAARLDRASLAAIDEFAAMYTARVSTSGTAVIDDGVIRPRMSIATPAAVSAIAPVASFPSRTLSPAVDVAAVTTGVSKVNQLLDLSIANLGALSGMPLSAPMPLGEQPPVPIEVLLYRGRAAIERCREIRDDARRNGDGLPPDALHELYDLLDLALVD